MVKYLLDTDHLVDLLKGENGVQERIAAEGLSMFAISAVSLGELFTYACKTGLERHFQECHFLENTFSVLPFSASRQYGEIRASLERQGCPLDDMDMLIGATALSSGLTLVSANRKHFSRIEGLEVISFREV